MGEDRITLLAANIRRNGASSGSVTFSKNRIARFA